MSLSQGTLLHAVLTLLGQNGRSSVRVAVPHAAYSEVGWILQGVPFSHLARPWCLYFFSFFSLSLDHQLVRHTVLSEARQVRPKKQTLSPRCRYPSNLIPNLAPFISTAVIPPRTFELQASSRADTSGNKVSFFFFPSRCHVVVYLGCVTTAVRTFFFSLSF